MAKELAFVLINPYTIAKSRTGGVIARYLARTDLELVAARMFGPSQELVESYAALVRSAVSDQPDTGVLIADYILKSYAPCALTGKPQRVMLLLFEGEDAIEKIWKVTGSVTLRQGSGETVRDTYGDYVLDDDGNMQYFEPAVLVAPSKNRASSTLSLWASYSSRDGGMIRSAGDVPSGENVQETLVMLKPDNFRYPSLRPGNIIDLLSSSGLRIVGANKFSMTVAQAEEFYKPVRRSLSEKFKEIGAKKAAGALSKEFGFKVSEDMTRGLCSQLGPMFADSQFESIVKFMTGYSPSECLATEKHVLGKESCLALVYEGIDAIRNIRSLLGSTDPRLAKPGSVRREFGANIMVNAAHASDSLENARREMDIIHVDTDTIKPYVNRHYGGVISKTIAMRAFLPKAGAEWFRRVRSSHKKDRAGSA